MTFLPTVHPPRRTKNVISAAAVVFRVTPAPTGGPQTTPVDDPPMLNPTNPATARPTSRRVETMPGRSYPPKYRFWVGRRRDAGFATPSRGCDTFLPRPGEPTGKC
jgi:hypothetical protein